MGLAKKMRPEPHFHLLDPPPVPSGQRLEPTVQGLVAFRALQALPCRMRTPVLLESASRFVDVGLETKSLYEHRRGNSEQFALIVHRLIEHCLHAFHSTLERSDVKAADLGGEQLDRKSVV